MKLNLLKMKFLIIVAVIFLVDIVSALEDCNTKFNLTDEEITKLKRAQLTDPSEDMKCLIECEMEEAGLIKNGELQEDVVIEKFGKENANKILESCRGEKGSTNCDTAFRLHNCFTRTRRRAALLEVLSRKV
uniref:OBP35 n=1 Tax=Episyrphus balteatus TaxID=286459 RepID=A0A6H0D402_EPIBA|nr:OBP35 [Episyrphus balteatus]